MNYKSLFEDIKNVAKEIAMTTPSASVFISEAVELLSSENEEGYIAFMRYLTKKDEEHFTLSYDRSSNYDSLIIICVALSALTVEADRIMVKAKNNYFYKNQLPF